MARKINRRKGKFRLAIIGEGITEWHYFNNLKQEKRFPYKLTPDLPKHSDYKYIFQKAGQLTNDGYDEVFCVLDVDVFKKDRKKEQQYQKDRLKLLKDPRIKIFESMPCIEYWFLLHYKNYSTKIYPTYDSLKTELKKYLPEYDKSNEYFEKVKIYQKLISEGNISKAISSAQKLRNEKTDNNLFPYSEIDNLLDQL